ncbi:hypothetical protein L6452_43877 [Arctium lappa]|uniref:Uncharacterized protein n=1 Tax=Arctium lappa TaxID=4217 RepID=A0ACB8XEN0_ARCLA|nr:hypothetical protein L6452_43877 [Arctium lappa]
MFRFIFPSFHILPSGGEIGFAGREVGFAGADDGFTMQRAHHSRFHLLHPSPTGFHLLHWFTLHGFNHSDRKLKIGWKVLKDVHDLKKLIVWRFFRYQGHFFYLLALSIRNLRTGPARDPNPPSLGSSFCLKQCLRRARKIPNQRPFPIQMQQHHLLTAVHPHIRIRTQVIMMKMMNIYYCAH